MSDDEKPLGYIVDQETRVDLLRNEAIAKVVVKLIRSRADTSVTIGVHGDWGAGKSSVLNMIEAEFEEGAGPAAGDSLCIRVNGWEYQGFEDAKIALIESVVTQLVESRGTYAKVKETFGRVRDSIDWLKATKRIGGLAFDLATGLPVATIATVVGSTMSDPGELMTRENAEAAAAEVKGVLKEGGAPSKTVPQELNEFRAAFAQLLSDAKIRRLVVLVDDLDRCLPETAIQTLEAIRLFVSLPKTAFVVGADERMIEYAVRQHFKDLPDEEAYRGYPRAYLEKLIQVPFRIPSLGEAETRIYVTMMLVGSLVDESGDGSRAHCRASTCTWSSSTSSTIRASVAATLSPVRMRRLTVARAPAGSTFAFTPPSISVAAQVVRRVAAVLGLARSSSTRSDSLHHRLASARRSTRPSSGARCSNKPRVPPLRRAGKGCASMRVTARATRPTAVCSGGALEWPPVPTAESSSER